MQGLATLFAATVLSASLVEAATYTVSDSFVGPSFFDGFSAEAIPDPTHGRVNYVSIKDAQSANLTYGNGNTFILRADHTATLTASGPGRNSVRLQSNKQWGKGLIVADLRHMPQGCGTWPAFWTVGDNWPANGEIDIVEGVNDQGTNQATLHTSNGCTIPSTTGATGSIVGTNCVSSASSNSGCAFKSNDPNSYGPKFNQNGGGWYVMERADTYINVWFWPRSASNVPDAIKNGANSVDTLTLGTSFAYFPNDSCDIKSHFGAHRIIINLTFCGDLADGSFASAGCSGTCADFVNNNPGAFADAYFDFAALRVYQ